MIHQCLSDVADQVFHGAISFAGDLEMEATKQRNQKYVEYLRIKIGSGTVHHLLMIECFRSHIQFSAIGFGLCIDRKKTLFFQQALYGIRWTGALIHPVANPLCFQGDLSRIIRRIIGPYVFQKPAIAWALAVSDDNSVKGFFFRAMSGQSDFNCHGFLSLSKRQHSLMESRHAALVNLFKHFQ